MRKEPAPRNWIKPVPPQYRFRNPHLFPLPEFPPLNVHLSLRFRAPQCSAFSMKPFLALCWCLLFCPMLLAAPKQHIVVFGKWTSVKWFVGEDETHSLDMKIRPLIVDGRNKEFTVGPAHDVTERTFVVQRMYRINDVLENDSLPNGSPKQESRSARWRWERGGWLLIDRVTGKVQAVPLPAFDPYYSTVTWFRDYSAYCGLSDDGKKLFAMVAQLGKRKPVLKKPIGDATDSDLPDSACPSAAWQRSPSRVTFAPQHDHKFTYTVRSRAVDLVSEDEDAGEE
jgi:hypothetical protein